MPAPISDSAVYQDVINGPVDGDDVDAATFLTNWLTPLASRDVWLKRAVGSYRAVAPGTDATDITEAVLHIQYGGGWAGPPTNGTVARFANERTGTRKMVLIDRIEDNQSLTFRNAAGTELGVYNAPQTQTRVAFEWVATNDTGGWTLVWSNATPFVRQYALTALGGTSMNDWGASEVLLAGFINTEFTLNLLQASIGGMGYFAPNELKRVRIRSMATGSIFRLAYSGNETVFTADRPMESVDLVFQYSAAGFGSEWILRSSTWRENGSTVVLNTTASPYQIPDGTTTVVNTASIVNAGFTLYAPENPWVGQEVTVVFDSITTNASHGMAIYNEVGGSVVASVGININNPINKGWMTIRYISNSVGWRCVSSGRNHQDNP